MNPATRLNDAIAANLGHPDLPAVEILWSALAANRSLTYDQTSLAMNWLTDVLS